MSPPTHTATISLKLCRYTTPRSYLFLFRQNTSSIPTHPRYCVKFTEHGTYPHGGYPKSAHATFLRKGMEDTWDSYDGTWRLTPSTYPTRLRGMACCKSAIALSGHPRRSSYQRIRFMAVAKTFFECLKLLSM